MMSMGHVWTYNAGCRSHLKSGGGGIMSDKRNFKVTNSPVTGNEFVMDPKERLVHLSGCSALKVFKEKRYAFVYERLKDVVDWGYKEICPECLGD
jgi:hypothetical protein